jgi:hypothetical protein
MAESSSLRGWTFEPSATWPLEFFNVDLSPHHAGAVGWDAMPLMGFDRPGLELLSAQGLESALLEAIALQNETVPCHPGKELRIFPSSPR